jgi:hypothetical protein
LGATSGPQGWLLLNEKFILPWLTGQTNHKGHPQNPSHWC